MILRSSLNTELAGTPNSPAISRPDIPPRRNRTMSARCASMVRGRPSLTPRRRARPKPRVVDSLAITAADSRAASNIRRSSFRLPASTMPNDGMTRRSPSSWQVSASPWRLLPRPRSPEQRIAATRPVRTILRSSCRSLMGRRSSFCQPRRVQKSQRRLSRTGSGA